MMNQEKTKFQEVSDQLEKKRKLISQAMAYISRGKMAGIPPEYIRTNKEQFKSLIFQPFYGNQTDKLVDMIYGDVGSGLEKYSVISLDGGNSISRKKAGFAILFRLILRDKFAKYMLFDDLNHRIMSPKTDGVYKNDMIEELKDVGALFIGEIDVSRFNAMYDTGSFFNDILDNRTNYRSPTILSFSNPVNSIRDTAACGQYISDIYGQEKSGNGVLRIRVQVEKN